jgi:hypothetical protein
MWTAGCILVLFILVYLIQGLEIGGTIYWNVHMWNVVASRTENCYLGQ